MLLLALLVGPLARAEISDGVVRVRVLNDISGVFQDYNAPGSVAAARVAAEDFMAANPAIRVEIVQGDHQNRPDVGSSIVRRWLDLDRVDAVVDGAGSGWAAPDVHRCGLDLVEARRATRNGRHVRRQCELRLGQPELA